jgi:hypothetical protein
MKVNMAKQKHGTLSLNRRTFFNAVLAGTTAFAARQLAANQTLELEARGESSPNIKD